MKLVCATTTGGHPLGVKKQKFFPIGITRSKHLAPSARDKSVKNEYKHFSNYSYLLLLLLFLFFSESCTSPKRDPFYNLREAKGNVHYGGIFQYAENENFRNLYPHNTIDGISQRIIRNIYEGLIRFNSTDLSVEPCIAESWEINKEGTAYTFFIRKGIYFHDDPCFAQGKGREVNAHDVKYCFDKLCEPDPNNQGYWIFKDRVKGADMYFHQSRQDQKTYGGVQGIKVIDDYTVQIELNKPFASFLHLLGTPFSYIFPKEAIDKYTPQGMRELCVGTGPFKLKTTKSGEAVVLIRNDNYWEKDELGNQLPYLDAIKVLFIFDKKAELFEFHKGNLDMCIPQELKDALKEHLRTFEINTQQFNLQTVPSLSIQYLRMYQKNSVFRKPEIRQAFNYAINKEYITTYVLKGEGQAAKNGFVPPFLKNYQAANIKGYEFDPDKAKDLLSKAGYPEGKKFPDVILHVTARERDQQIAGIIQKMLNENLNVKIKIVTLPLAQLIESFENGESSFWLSRWGADYPDPENFLNIFHGSHIPTDSYQKSHLNSERYFNFQYDSLLDEANRTIEVTERFRLYEIADQILINDAVTIPLFYSENYRLVKLYIKGFVINGMDYRDLRKVYFDKNIVGNGPS